jgi:hypothetical protein
MEGVDLRRDGLRATLRLGDRSRFGDADDPSPPALRDENGAGDAGAVSTSPDLVVVGRRSSSIARLDEGP